MTTTTATPQAISELLTAAGFERGVSNPPEQECAGFAVIPNRPGDGIVLVNWWHAPGTDGGEAEHARMLSAYAEVLEGAGHAVRQSADGAYLIVTAREETR